MTAPLKPCGTVAAYSRHLYHGEDPCRECLAAINTANKPRGRAKWELARLHWDTFLALRAEELASEPDAGEDSLRRASGRAGTRLASLHPGEFAGLLAKHRARLAKEVSR
ncbi:hypothetical protein [Actinomadura rupiterrae]|uniref:hypothetical protein n=1 Tax=Actinomadura rupiterrae TaxID=559627 RepID=UPI0020A561AB|nr:hypothetical protein [Actinomadura rupiterrae]MCP2339217.1 hypothetical protein [Actinomadura rupiterrae]